MLRFSTLRMISESKLDLIKTLEVKKKKSAIQKKQKKGI